jgi:hypothetical protein
MQVIVGQKADVYNCINIDTMEKLRELVKRLGAVELSIYEGKLRLEYSPYAAKSKTSL